MYKDTAIRSTLPADENRLAASLAHEIKNPLDAILSLLYLVKLDGSLSDKGREYLTMAEQEVHRIAQITRDALSDFRDIQGSRETNVPELLGSVIEFYRPRLVSRGILVETRYGASGNVPVCSGPLRQVFSNLLLNAADSMLPGGRLQARTSNAREQTGAHRDGLRVTIADNGCGIAENNIREIFDPFFTTKGSGGSGLGLALVKEVVQKHGGRLRVRSSTRPGHSGSVFSIFLPAA